MANKIIPCPRCNGQMIVDYPDEPRFCLACGYREKIEPLRRIEHGRYSKSGVGR